MCIFVLELHNNGTDYNRPSVCEEQENDICILPTSTQNEMSSPGHPHVKESGVIVRESAD